MPKNVEVSSTGLPCSGLGGLSIILGVGIGSSSLLF